MIYFFTFYYWILTIRYFRTNDLTPITIYWTFPCFGSLKVRIGTHFESSVLLFVIILCWSRNKDKCCLISFDEICLKDNTSLAFFTVFLFWCFNGVDDKSFLSNRSSFKFLFDICQCRSAYVENTKSKILILHSHMIMDMNHRATYYLDKIQKDSINTLSIYWFQSFC